MYPEFFFFLLHRNTENLPFKIKCVGGLLLFIPVLSPYNSFSDIHNSFLDIQ